MVYYCYLSCPSLSHYSEHTEGGTDCFQLKCAEDVIVTVILCIILMDNVPSYDTVMRHIMTHILVFGE